MPLYEYQCTRCEHRFERLQRFSDPPITVCPACGGPVSQLLSAPAIQFKGSGWYVTDYAHKSSGPAPGNGKSGNGGNGASSGEHSAPAKTESPSPSASSESK